MIKERITKAWSGQERLVVVFWGYYLVLSLIITALIPIALGLAGSAGGAKIALFLGVPLIIAYTVWVLVSLWRSALNCRWKGWGYMARVLVVLSIVQELMLLEQVSREFL